jgi:hypothetical protein
MENVSDKSYHIQTLRVLNALLYGPRYLKPTVLHCIYVYLSCHCYNKQHSQIGLSNGIMLCSVRYELNLCVCVCVYIYIYIYIYI